MAYISNNYAYPSIVDILKHCHTFGLAINHSMHLINVNQ